MGNKQDVPEEQKDALEPPGTHELTVAHLQSILTLAKPVSEKVVTGLAIQKPMERIASILLEYVLGDYVEGLNCQNITVGTSGFELANLSLKKTALNAFELPMVIKEGKQSFI